MKGGRPQVPPASRWLQALHAADPNERREAADKLGNVGPAAKTAVPALQDLREHDPDPGVRSYAGRALEKIQAGGDGAPPGF